MGLQYTIDFNRFNEYTSNLHSSRNVKRPKEYFIVPKQETDTLICSPLSNLQMSRG